MGAKGLKATFVCHTFVEPRVLLLSCWKLWLYDTRSFILLMCVYIYIYIHFPLSLYISLSLSVMCALMCASHLLQLWAEIRQVAGFSMLLMER